MHLGLDATIERIRLAGGEIEIDSAPGEGTRISFRLPGAEVEAEQRPTSSPSAPERPVPAVISRPATGRGYPLSRAGSPPTTRPAMHRGPSGRLVSR